MKKLYFIPLVILVIVGLVLGSCGKATPTPTPTVTTPKPTATTTAPTTTQPTTSPPITHPSPTAQPTSQIKKGGTLRYIYDVSPASIPGWPYDQTDQQRIWANWVCFEPLVRLDANGEPMPWLATKWEWGPDKMSLTFTLRDGVKFHDGTSFNATAVKALSDQLFTDKDPLTTYWSSWEIVDSMTVKLNLKTFNRNIWSSIGGFEQVSPTVLAQGVAYTHAHPCGTGPFKFLDFKKDVYLKFTKNDNYWQPGKPYLDEIDFLTVVEGLTQQAMMVAGEADMMGIMQGKILQDLKNKGYNVIPLYGGTNFLLFDTKNKDSIYNDPKIRMALEYATNKDEMADALGYGYYMINNQMLPHAFPGHTAGLTSRDFDPDKARELLAEAGHPHFTMDLVVMNIYSDAGVMMKQFYEDVGITVNLNVVDSPKYWDYILGGWTGVLFAGYGMPLNIASFVLNYFPPIAPFDVSCEIPADMATVANAYIGEKDDAKAKQLNDQLNQMIFDQCYFVPFYSNAFAHVLNPYVKGGNFDAYVDFMIWDPADVWMDK